MPTTWPYLSRSLTCAINISRARYQFRPFNQSSFGSLPVHCFISGIRAMVDVTFEALMFSWCWLFSSGNHCDMSVVAMLLVRGLHGNNTTGVVPPSWWGAAWGDHCGNFHHCCGWTCCHCWYPHQPECLSTGWCFISFRLWFVCLMMCCWFIMTILAIPCRSKCSIVYINILYLAPLMSFARGNNFI